MSSVTQRADWDTLFDALREEQVAMAERVSAQLHSEIASYRPVPLSRLTEDVAVELDRVLRTARSGPPAGDDPQLAELWTIGDARARQGVPVDDMLRAWRTGIQVALERARELASQLGVSDRSLLDFVEYVFAGADVAMVVTARAHREAEITLARQDQDRRAALVVGLLLGTLAPGEIGVQASAYGVDPTGTYVAVRAALAPDVEQQAFAESLGFGRARNAGMWALIKGDLAGFLPSPPTADGTHVVGVGPPLALDRLAESFRLATRALVTAQGFGLTGVYDIPALGLRATVLTDSDVGDALEARYVEPVLREGSGEELIASLRAYFECGMNVERAAARLFVHQNTLRYRLGRFESITGANLRDPETAFEVWWALERQVVTARA